MRFSTEQGYAITEGTKTTHRIPPGKGYAEGTTHPLSYPHVELDSYDQPILDGEGNQRKTSATGLHLRIVSVDVEPLRAIENPQKLRAEGFMRLEDFALDWLGRYDSDPAMRNAAKRRAGDWTDLSDPVQTWRDRHGHKDCRVLHLEVVRLDKSLYLAQQQGVSEAGQYTTNPARAVDDAPVVDDETLKGYARENWQRFAESRGEREQRDRANRLGARIREETVRAGRLGMDISEPLERIQRELDSIRAINEKRRMDEAA